MQKIKPLAVFPKGSGANHVAMIPNDRLKFDDDYQRALNTKTVNDNATEGNFDPLAYRSLTVSLRSDGYYYIIDGKQRHGVFTVNGWTVFRCEVYVGLTREEEAGLFEKLNNVRLINSAAKFRAKVCRGEPKAVQIMGIVAHAGFQIRLQPGRPPLGTPNVLGNVSGLQKVVNIYGGLDTLRNVLRVIVESFQNDDTGFVQGEAQRDLFIRGIAHYLYERKGNVNDAISVLKEKEATTWKTTLIKKYGPSAVRKDGAPWLAEEIVDTLACRKRNKQSKKLKLAA